MSQWFVQYGLGQVHPGLYSGAVPLDAHDIQVLADLGVSRVLNLVEDGEYPDGARLEVTIALEANGIAERRVDVVDFGNLSAPALEEAVGQVLAWLEEDHTVYLHCRAGWQRSATVAAGVIALSEERELGDALTVLRERKESANPLPHQREDLYRWWAARAAPSESATESETGTGT